MDKNTKKFLLLLGLIWLFRTKYQVTTGITFPTSPTGNCYDPETQTYYVGDC